MSASTHVLALPALMLRRGFWLYVWRVETPKDEMLYVGRTGDNSSPHATAPYTRMGQHLGSVKTQNALRQHLRKPALSRRIARPFISWPMGRSNPEVEHAPGLDRTALMAKHMPLRDLIGAMEKALAEELKQAGYRILNTVKWKHPHDPVIWETVRSAFAARFPRLTAGEPQAELDRLEVAK